MELISVIVPVYKVEQYLNRCIESLVNQTYSNLEIILVDDGSPDNSPKICDEWAKKDSRIKVIHKDNTGAGASRNVGLLQAHGDFISFIDSDDYVSKDFYSHLFQLFKHDVDIVEGEYTVVDSHDNEYQFSDEASIAEEFSLEQAMYEHLNEHKFKQVIWNKLYRRSAIKNVLFPEGNRIDDEYWTYRIIGNSRKLIHSDKVIYAYRQQSDSVMHLLKIQERTQAINARISRSDFILKEIPSLYNFSVYTIWCICLYNCQKALIEDKALAEQLIDYSKKVIKTHKLSILELKDVSLTQKLWLFMMRLSFTLTCNIRNMIKIGL